MSPAQAQQNGEDITARLEQLSLTTVAFAYLARFRDAAVRQAPLLTTEWDDVYSILAQVRKRRASAQWRDEEAADVVLGPDRFIIPDPPPLQFPPATRPALAAWRASDSDLQDWQDRLQARIDQESGVRSGYDDALGAAEAGVLPSLRDALVLAADPPANPPLASLQEKARWITDHLLIDAEADGCQQTTRVSQAIETIQGLLWSVRTGLLGQVYPQLSLDADVFDAEWQWIGSYAAWRAAMFIFLYPENLLVPGLRRHQTPGFRRLIGDLRANRALGPEQACQAAKTYSDYFKDICNLTVVAACQASTLVYSGSCRSRTEQSERSLLYIFATGAVTGTLYWSTYDAVAADVEMGFAQTFWEPVPGVDPGVTVLAAIPYMLANGDRYLYLFAHDRGQQRLLYSRYKLQTQQWTDVSASLDLPKQETGGFTIVVKQRSNETDPPHVAVQASGRVLANQMNRAGDGWASDNWTLLVIPPQQLGFDPIGRLVAMVGTASGRFVLFAQIEGGDGLVQYRCFGTPGDPFWRWLGQGSWIGALAWPGTEDIYAFQTVAGVSICRRIQAADDAQATPISPGQAIPPDISALQSSFFRLDSWLADTAGITLSGISMADVFQFGGDWWNYDLQQVLAWDPANPPMRILADTWKGLIQKALDWLDGRIKSDEAWKFADDLVQRFAGRRLRDLIETVRAQQPAGLPQRDPAPAITAMSNMLDLVQVAQVAWPTPAGQVPDVIAVAYQRISSAGPSVFQSNWFRNAATAELSPGTELSAAPVVTGPFDIVEHQSEAALQLRRQQIQDSFLQNMLSPRSNLTYLEEAYYFVPVQIALALQDRGHYVAALDWLRTVYDYSAPVPQRKIYYGLVQEELLQTTYARPPHWLGDPLNPHATAETRADTYTRFTLLSIVRCLLQYADAEFTKDTAESVPRARDLYLAVLDLLNAAELQQSLNGCEKLIGTLDIDVGDPQWNPIIGRIKRMVGKITDFTTLQATVQGIAAALRADRPPQDRVSQALSVTSAALARLPAPSTYNGVVAAKPERTARVARSLLAEPSVASAAIAAGAAASRDFSWAISAVTGMPAAAIVKDNIALPWLRDAQAKLQGDGTREFAGDRWSRWATVDPLDTLLRIRGNGGSFYVPAPAFDFCIPPNPVIRSLRLRAELNLYKLRTCRNIAGIKRTLDPYAAPTDTTTGLPQIGPGGQLDLPGALTLGPTPYRYRALIDRAKQLVQVAAQMEAAMLAALEKRDAEFYAELKARQDLHLAQAGVRLEDLRVQQAQDGVTLANLQQQRAQIQVDYYQQLLAEGISALEKDALSLMGTAADLQLVSSILDFTAAFTYLNAAISARLLQDIQQLDQFAFDTDRRKLQLTKILSLARLAPAEFQRFRETGVLNFATPMELFDGDFPGHYLRLVKRVRVSVIALIPPTQGIRATLSSTGISRVIVGGDVFQTTVIHRDPETVAFSSPQNATGLFELEPPSDMLLPFEGQGVDARWEFRMPRPANQFDFTTIADVLIALEYTALDSADYRQQVIQRLDRPISADLPFSFRNRLADAWYDLHNPDQSATPMIVRFPTTRDDFPPNLDNLRIQQLVLYFARTPGSRFEVEVTYLRFIEQGSNGPVGGEATSIDSVISTRSGSAASWAAILGKAPFGVFELALPNDPETRRLFSEEQVQDMLLVVTYSGRLPGWPA